MPGELSLESGGGARVLIDWCITGIYPRKPLPRLITVPEPVFGSFSFSSHPKARHNWLTQGDCSYSITASFCPHYTPLKSPLSRTTARPKENIFFFSSLLVYLPAESVKQKRSMARRTPSLWSSTSFILIMSSLKKTQTLPRRLPPSSQKKWPGVPRVLSLAWALCRVFPWSNGAKWQQSHVRAALAPFWMCLFARMLVGILTCILLLFWARNRYNFTWKICI